MEIRTEQVKVEDDDGGVDIEEQDFAYIRLTNGKIKKMVALPDWKAGSHIEKRRGEGWFRVT